MRWTHLILAATLSAKVWAAAPGEAEKPDFWLNLHAGEEIASNVVYDDLASADLIYLGEYHSDRRHHDIQAAVLKELRDRKVPLVVGMEQIEARYQSEVDRFNRGELTFDGLAEAIEWKKQWKQYELYREICETAQAAGIPVRGLNAPADIIRAIGRNGLAALPPADRTQLPDEIVTEDPVYQKLVMRMLGGHSSMTPEKLASFFAAQVARDETMAANICASYRASDGSPRKVIVICGRGHVSHGLGTPARVLRRLPGLQQRIVHLSYTRGGGRRFSGPENGADGPNATAVVTKPTPGAITGIAVAAPTAAATPAAGTTPAAGIAATTPTAVTAPAAGVTPVAGATPTPAPSGHGLARPAMTRRPLAEWQDIGGLPADYLCFRPRSPEVGGAPNSE